MAKVKVYVAPNHKPVSGLTVTWNRVKSLGLGNSIVATLPPSNSAISVSFFEKGERRVFEMNGRTKKGICEVSDYSCMYFYVPF